MAQEELSVEEIIPGLIVRHTNRRLGKLDITEACERLITGKISFSEFVDQAGEGFRELLDFMMEHDLHPGRPDEVLYCVDCYAARAARYPIQPRTVQLLRPNRRRQATRTASKRK